jgi:nucleoid DNA-binding protein/ribosomal protein S27AE
VSTATKQEINRRVAFLCGQTEKTIAGITDAFLNEVMQHLVDGDEVNLSGFGTFHVSVRRGATGGLITTLTKGSFKKGENRGTATVLVERKYYVNFKRAIAFRERFWERYGKQKPEDHMDKFGVDESGSDQEKTAAEGCPKCGSKDVQKHGNILACPNCGTEPFEKKGD